MKICIPTIGTRGDVQPYIALAQRLAQSGHQATLATSPAMKNLVESHDVVFAPIGPDIHFATEMAAIRQKARSPIAGLVQGMRLGFNLFIYLLCERYPTSSFCSRLKVNLVGLIPIISQTMRIPKVGDFL